MRSHGSLILATAALLALADPLHAQSNQRTGARTTKARTNQELMLGQLRVLGNVHVGESVPDFTAVSSSGRQVTVSRQRGEWLVLLFAETREDFNRFRDVHQELKEAGAIVFGVCKEKPQRLRALVERDSLPFDLLADDTGDVSAVYGLFDLHRRSTVPGFVLADRQGVVRMVLQGQAPPKLVSALTRFAIDD